MFSEKMGEAGHRASSLMDSAAQWIGFAGDAVRHRIADLEQRARDAPTAGDPATKQDLVARFWQHLNRTYATPPGEITERNFMNLFAAHMKLVRLLERKGVIDGGEAESLRPKQLCAIIEQDKSLFAPCVTGRVYANKRHKAAQTSQKEPNAEDLDITEGHEDL